MRSKLNQTKCSSQLAATLADGDCVAVHCSSRWPCGRDKLESACSVIVAHGLRCRLFTVLRHPISRLLSAYSYFCLDCAESGRQCAGSHSHPERIGLTCPHMSLEEYARYFGSMYAGFFGLGEGGKANSTDAALEADRWLREQRALVLTTEHDLASESPFVRLGKWMGDAWVGAWVDGVGRFG